MKRQSSFNNNKPTLYLIPTPIGNLEDMTFRSIKILKQVDYLFAEDTRVSYKLLNHFEIKKDLKSYHKHNKNSKNDYILKLLEEGKNVGLISDAGMPLISDPGYEITCKVIEQGFNVVSLPGANALLTALVVSGIKPHPFTFYGFLDHKDSKKRKELNDIKNNPNTIIFYESPHRIKQTINLMYEIFGERRFVIARELTKKFEEIIRGNLKDYMEINELKGEIVIVLEGSSEEFSFENITVLEHIKLYLDTGMTEKDAIKKVSKERKVLKNEVYSEYHRNK